MRKINELIQTLCPDGVEYKKLGEVANISSGKNKERLPYGMYKVYGSTGVIAYTNTAVYNEQKILIARVGANAGYVHIADGEYDVSDNTLIVNIQDSIVLKYLYYILINEELGKYSKGGGQPLVTAGDMKNIKIPVPPRPVQDEIVRILDEYTELEAELEAKLSEEIELKQKQYEYCASKLFEDLNVEYTPMSELAKFKYGYTDKASDSGNARFIRITDIDDFGELSSADEKYIMLTDGAEKYLLTKGSLVVARTGATYGKTLYFDSDEPAVYASFLIKIDFDNNQVLNRYYWHFTKTALYWEQANKYVKVGGQQQFNSPALGRVCVPVPSITEQERIVKILDKYDTYTRDMISALNTELESRKKQYAYYRDQLLTFKRKE